MAQGHDTTRRQDTKTRHEDTTRGHDARTRHEDEDTIRHDTTRTTTFGHLLTPGPPTLKREPFCRAFGNTCLRAKRHTSSFFLFLLSLFWNGATALSQPSARPPLQVSDQGDQPPCPITPPPHSHGQGRDRDGRLECRSGGARRHFGKGGGV